MTDSTPAPVRDVVERLESSMPSILAMRDGAQEIRRLRFQIAHLNSESVNAVTKISRLRKDLAEAHLHIVRLTGCLHAMAGAGPSVTADAFRSVSYDTVMNLITPDVAEYQLQRRSTDSASLPPPQDDSSTPSTTSAQENA